MPRKNAAKFSFSSKSGDFIGQGLSRSYDLNDSKIVVCDVGHVNRARTNAVRFTVERDSENWNIEFAAPKGMRLRVGEYLYATRFPFNADESPGLNMSGCGRGSSNSYGRFSVDLVRFNKAGELVLFKASFVQHSETMTAPPLEGNLYYCKLRQK